jgi:hypothetical protein
MAAHKIKNKGKASTFLKGMGIKDSQNDITSAE